jgi:hypothetical protein
MNRQTGMTYEGWKNSYETLLQRRKDGLDKGPGFIDRHIKAAPEHVARYVLQKPKFPFRTEVPDGGHEV